MSANKLFSLFALLLITFALPQFVAAQTVTPTTEISISPTQTAGESTSENEKTPGKRDFGKDLREQQKMERGKMRATVDELEDRLEERKENFKQRLTGLRDEKKKTVLIRLDTRISSISANRTGRMADAIEKLDTALEKIKAKAELATQNGAATTALDAAIADADKALASASAAVTAQAAKTYTIEVSDDATKVKPVIGETFKTLQADLRETHRLVMEAKKAVMKAAKELRKISGKLTLSGSPAPTASITATITAAPTLTQTLTPTTEPAL